MISVICIWISVMTIQATEKYSNSNVLRDLWHLRHWLQFWRLRTWIHDNLCYLTIKSDIGQHSQFLRCFMEDHMVIMTNITACQWLFAMIMISKYRHNKKSAFGCRIHIVDTLQNLKIVAFGCFLHVGHACVTHVHFLHCFVMFTCMLAFVCCISHHAYTKRYHIVLPFQNRRVNS